MAVAPRLDSVWVLDIRSTVKSSESLVSVINRSKARSQEKSTLAMDLAAHNQGFIKIGSLNLAFTSQRAEMHGTVHNKFIAPTREKKRC